MNLNLDSIERGLEGLLRTLFAVSLQRGDISLSTESVRIDEVSGMKISITPQNSGCAEIHIFCENGIDMIYLSIGQNTSLEVPPEGMRYTKLSGSDEFVALVNAVAEGRFEEDVWIRNSRVMKSVGRIFLPNGLPVTIKMFDNIFANLFPSLEKQTYKYLPYSD